MDARQSAKGVFGAGGEGEDEGAAAAGRALEGDGAAVLVDDDRAGDREALAGAAADFAGGEIRLEDLRLQLVGDAAAGVAHRDADGVLLAPGLDPDPAEGAAAGVGDREGGVDDQLEEHLAEVADVAGDQRQRAEIGLHLGDVLVLVAGDDERVEDRLVDVGGGLVAAVGGGELLHRADGGGDAGEALEGALEGGALLGVDQLEVGVRERVVDRLDQLGGEAGGAGGVDERAAGGDQRIQRGAGVAEVVEAVADVLHGGVDLVGDAGGEAADRLELLRVAQLDLVAAALGELLAQRRVLSFELAEADGVVDRDYAFFGGARHEREIVAATRSFNERVWG